MGCIDLLVRYSKSVLYRYVIIVLLFFIGGKMKKILIMGMGAIGHTIATSLDSKKVKIDIATSKQVEVKTIENNIGDIGHIDNVVTYDMLEKSCDYDIIFLTLPYRYKINRMNQLVDVISKDATIVVLPANQGALHYLPTEIQKQNPIILSERVPQIARLEKQYEKVNVFGTRRDLKMVGINGADPLVLSEIIPYLDQIQLEKNEFEISMISSNAILHTSRLYNLFSLNNEKFDEEILFYKDWTLNDGELLISMEDEVLNLKEKIEVVENIDIDLYDIYTHFKIEPKTARMVVKQVSTNEALNKITFYAKDKNDLMSNRYLVDDAILGLNYFIKLADKYQVEVPNLKLVHNWAIEFSKEEIGELNKLNV